MTGDAIPIQKRFRALCAITRAQHFAWRQAVAEAHGTAAAAAAVQRMWVITGHETARAYLARIDRARPLLAQVAESIVWSSQCMGEDAVLELEGDEAYVRHRDCPWYHAHRRQDLLSEDRTGCDAWFGALIEAINGTLGTDLRCETLATLPDGCGYCLRRLYSAGQGRGP